MKSLLIIVTLLMSGVSQATYITPNAKQITGAKAIVDFKNEEITFENIVWGGCQEPEYVIRTNNYSLNQNAFIVKLFNLKPSRCRAYFINTHTLSFNEVLSEMKKARLFSFNLRPENGIIFDEIPMYNTAGQQIYDLKVQDLICEDTDPVVIAPKPAQVCESSQRFICKSSCGLIMVKTEDKLCGDYSNEVKAEYYHVNDYNAVSSKVVVYDQYQQPDSYEKYSNVLFMQGGEFQEIESMSCSKL